MKSSLASGRVAGVLALAFGLGFGATTLGNRSSQDDAGVEPQAQLQAEPQQATAAPAWQPVNRAAAQSSATLAVDAGEQAAPDEAAAAQPESARAAASDVASKPDPSAPRIIVSIDDRHLWYVVGRDTLLSAPVAVGMNKSFEFDGKRFHFSTPRGTRRVLRKEENPIWTVPVWHYYERAKWEDLEIVFLEPDSRITLGDGTVLVVEGDQVGRINHFGNFWPITPGNEIIFDGKVFVPPMNTQQRRVPDALGPYKLDTGDGYLIHGTHIYNEDSVGDAVSHGCVRMTNADLERLYWMVEPGTPVIIR